MKVPTALTDELQKDQERKKLEKKKAQRKAKKQKDKVRLSSSNNCEVEVIGVLHLFRKRKR